MKTTDCSHCDHCSYAMNYDHDGLDSPWIRVDLDWIDRETAPSIGYGCWTERMASSNQSRLESVGDLLRPKTMLAHTVDGYCTKNSMRRQFEVGGFRPPDWWHHHIR